MVAIAASLLGAAFFAASGFAIYRSASRDQAVLVYYVQFFLSGIIAIVIAALCGVHIALSASAVVLGILLLTGNLLLSSSYGRGPSVATAISISFASVLAIIFGAVVLGDTISLKGWLGVLLLIAAVVAAGVTSTKQPSERGSLWLILVAATCVLLAARAVLLSWRLTTSDDVASLVLVAYSVAAVAALVSLFLAQGRRGTAPLTAALKPSLSALLAGALSLLGLMCFGFALRTGEVIVANAIFGVYPALTVFAIALDSRSFDPMKVAAVSLAIAGIVLLALRSL